MIRGLRTADGSISILAGLESSVEPGQVLVTLEVGNMSTVIRVSSAKARDVAGEMRMLASDLLAAAGAADEARFSQ